MKKLLLILALLTYVAISCDKPETIAEQPDNETTETLDNSADTCKLSFITTTRTPIVMVYKTHSSNVDFDASVNSIFKHFTITLKNGCLDTAVCTNAYSDSFFPSDSGFINGAYQTRHFDSLKYGNYFIVLWNYQYGYCWGSNFYNDKQTFLYHDLMFNADFTSETIDFNEELLHLLLYATPLTFNNF